ncbi:SgcJ/EcaC family oxidoreductase [Nonomuraea longicatena]|uniref:DUF4440 domain-containing protein n=1 Tax=Nonomuraea longicatena TaxID=83682 RepID=A0ABN1QW47_9ACTN
MSTTMPTEVPAAQQAAVATIAQRMIAAWAHHDADGFANLFIESGTLILPGVLRQGREDIRAFFKHAFENEFKGTQVTGKPISMRFFGPDVALLLSQGGVIAPGETEVADAQSIRASWFVVRVDDQWQLAAYQNSPMNTRLATPGS